MITYKVNKIAKKLKTEFYSPKRPASHFTNIQLWNDCLSIFSDQNRTEKIIFSNDLGVPPVKAVIKILIDDYNYPPNTKFSAEDARNLGALMSFIFMHILRYDESHGRRTVKMCGIKEGCVFTHNNTAPQPQDDSTVANNNEKKSDKKRDFGDW